MNKIVDDPNLSFDEILEQLSRAMDWKDIFRIHRLRDRAISGLRSKDVFWIQYEPWPNMDVTLWLNVDFNLCIRRPTRDEYGRTEIAIPWNRIEAFDVFDISTLVLIEFSNDKTHKLLFNSPLEMFQFVSILCTYAFLKLEFVQDVIKVSVNPNGPIGHTIYKRPRSHESHRTLPGYDRFIERPRLRRLHRRHKPY